MMKKRQKLNVNDMIIFSCLPELTEKIKCRVADLFHYQTFRELFDSFPINRFGYDDEDELLSLTYSIYTPNQEKKYGVLGIEVELIEE